MHVWKKYSRQVALLIYIVSLIVVVVSNHYLASKTLSFPLQLIIAIAMGIISFSIMEYLPKLLLREKSLCGLYFIVYRTQGKLFKNNFCSVINIDYNSKHEQYSIDIYDYFMKNSTWYSENGKNPLSIDNVFYDYRPQRIHLVSDDEEKKVAIFIRFISGNRPLSVLRYDNTKTLAGRLIELRPSDLCRVFNEDFNETSFCNQKISDGIRCQSTGRRDCHKSIKPTLLWVNKKDPSYYIKIPKVLYDELSLAQEPIENFPLRVRTKKKLDNEATKDTTVQDVQHEKTNELSNHKGNSCDNLREIAVELQEPTVEISNVE